MANDNVIWRSNISVSVVKNNSLTAMEQHANKQIDSLKKQAALLVEQASEIQKRVELTYLVSGARYNFKPVMLKEYYLYKKIYNGIKPNELTLTLISPKEWGVGGSPYGECVACVRQLGDSTWEEVSIISNSNDDDEKMREAS